MRRVCSVFALSATIVLCAMVAWPTITHAALSGADYACREEDSSLFPYKFLCPRDGNQSVDSLGDVGQDGGFKTSFEYHKGDEIISADGESGLRAVDRDNDSTSIGAPTNITTRATITASLKTGTSGSKASANGSEGAPVLVWIYVNPQASTKPDSTGRNTIPKVIASHTSDVKGLTSEGTRNCPGTGQQDRAQNIQTGKVWYKRDASNPKDNSPYANGSDPTAGVNCFNNGKIAYWYFANGIPDRVVWNDAFRVNIEFDQDEQNYTVCVRQIVSVGGQAGNTGIWPDSPNSENTADARTAMKKDAAYVAKESKRLCYSMTNYKPFGYLRTLQCGRYTVDGVIDGKWGDQDPPSITNRPYRIVHGGTVHGTREWTPDSNGVIDVSGVNTVNGQGSGTIPNYVQNRLYRLVVQDVQTGKWYSPRSDSDGSSSLRAPIEDCAPPTENCRYVTITNGGPNSTTNYQTIVRVTDTSGNTLINDTISRDGERQRYTYTPMGTSVTVTVTHQSQPKDGSNGPWSTISTDSDTYVCYNPRCTLEFDGPGPNNILLKGQPFTVHAAITNTLIPGETNMREIPTTGMAGIGGYLSYTTTNGGQTPHTFPGGIPLSDPSNPVAVDSNDMTLVANPDSSGTITVTGYPDYYGVGALRWVDGAGNTVARSQPGSNIYMCNGTQPIYEKFNIVPTSTMDNVGTIEDVSGITYTSKGHKTEGPNVNTTVTTELRKENTGQPVQTLDSHADGYTFGADNNPFSYSYPVTAKPGDRYCAYTTIHWGTGYVDQNGNYFGQSDTTDSSGCLTVVNQPYVNFSGGDVSAGGGFEGTGTCDNKGGILTYYKAAGANSSGSGVQIGALSIGPINGFTSAHARTTAPTPATGLSFSNTDNIGSASSSSAGTGGNMGGTHCVPNYFSAMKPETKSAVNNSTSIPSVSGGTSAYYVPAGGKLTLPTSNGTVPLGKRTVIFVDGDVEITRNITYANTDNYGSIDQIPFFMLVVRGGKITINNSVTQLDGLYVSQPDSSGKGGTIDTCENDNANAALTACNNQLVVNGSFVARRVNFLRGIGSLRDSQFGEGYGATGPTQCSIDAGKKATALKTCAAEIIRFNPEVYLAQPDLVPRSGPTTGTYDYITSLPPVL